MFSIYQIFARLLSYKSLISLVLLLNASTWSLANSNNEPTELNDLNDDVVLDVMEFLDPNSLRALMSTDRRFYQLGAEHLHWKSHCAHLIKKRLKFFHFYDTRFGSHGNKEHLDSLVKEVEQFPISNYPELSWSQMYVTLKKLTCNSEEYNEIETNVSCLRTLIQAAVPTLINSVLIAGVGSPAIFAVGLVNQAIGVALISTSGLHLLTLSPVSGICSAGLGAGALFAGALQEAAALCIVPPASVALGFYKTIKDRQVVQEKQTLEFKQNCWEELEIKFESDEFPGFLEVFRPVNFRHN